MAFDPQSTVSQAFTRGAKILQISFLKFFKEFISL
jgi:hypothetical protein